ncbi:Endonuclease/exonuclease/phosphatase [Cynara cardunculus var. scolymus]|uniref:Endonuclease/exonuclease/phosphatase n=1 Tax=Cynara cardunculus var. scolymus TaxID=59895 RepID=A0A103XGS9_CYNCS|nr:Endonuclease/exonuclease/phosphatase [Cynara cardunculus var. scolymus]
MKCSCERSSWMVSLDGQFGAWHEGTIDFAPTYKYLPDSDEYFVKNQEMKRAPAWCDRIIWSGKELKQILYTRSISGKNGLRASLTEMFLRNT